MAAIWLHRGPRSVARSILRLVFPLAVVVTLVGCGGGSGNSASTSASAGQSQSGTSAVAQNPSAMPSYEFNALEPAFVDETHAADLVTASMQLLQGLVDSGLDPDNFPAGQVVQKTVSGSVSGTATIQGRFDSEGNGWLAIRFSRYQDGTNNGLTAIPKLTVNGRQIITIKWKDFGSHRDPVMTIGFDHLRQSTRDYDFTYVGTIKSTRTTVDFDHRTTELTANYAVHDNRSGDDLEIHNVSLTNAEDNRGVPGAILDAAGEFCASSIGCWTIATPDRLKYEFHATDTPFDGTLRITAGTDSTAVIAHALNRNYAAIGIDDDGDGLPKKTALYDWSAWGLYGQELPGKPVAYAGPRKQVAQNDTVALQGGFSRSPEGKFLSYHWTIEQAPIGSEATLSDSDSPTPSLVADVLGDYLIGLDVSDGTTTVHDSTVVSATWDAESQPPSDHIVGANLPADRKAVAGQPFALSMDSSEDESGASPVEYHWYLTAVPPGSQAVLDDPTSATPTFVPDLPGYYTIDLTVGSASDSTKTWRDSETIAVGVDMRFEAPVTLSFNEPNDDTGAADTSVFRMADVNQDGALDLVIGWTPTGEIYPQAFMVLPQTAPGRFARGASFPGSNIGAVTIGDVDGDGYQDIVAGSVYNGIAPQYFRGLPDGGFASPVFAPPAAALCHYYLGAVGLADLDGNGQLSILAGSGCSSDSELAAIEPQADGSLSSPTYVVAPGDGVSSPQTADMNGDGRQDAVMIGFGDISAPMAKIDVIAQPAGSPDPQLTQSVDLAVQYVVGFRVADFNGDGRPDVAVSENEQVEVSFEDAMGKLQPPVALPLSDSGDGIAAADMNHDGLVDLVAADEAEPAVTGIFLQQSDGSLGPEAVYPARELLFFSGNPIPVDLNGDGNIDLVYPIDDGVRNGLYVLYGSRF